MNLLLFRPRLKARCVARAFVGQGRAVGIICSMDFAPFGSGIRFTIYHRTMGELSVHSPALSHEPSQISLLISRDFGSLA
jgi:hypothetical protein